MDIIQDMNKITSMILSKQEYSDKTKYRLLKYVVEISVDKGIILHNFLTGQTIILSLDEYRGMNDGYNEIIQKLVEVWFMVPVDYNERSLYDTIFFINKQASKTDYINNFVILTTLECNARCFYCFENGKKRYPMTVDTANAVADYIIKVSKGNKVNIQWFGGEPLYNEEVIDIICEKLSKNSVIFNSDMISNGYLFDDVCVNKAKEKWNLSLVQITLDGTQDIYNKYKAYIYDDPNPFHRVITNIKLLIANKINVKIRINLGDHNEADIYSLIDYIYKEVGPSPYLDVYSWLLYERCLYGDKKHSAAQKNVLREKQINLENYIYKKGLKSVQPISDRIAISACMAEDDNSVVIVPDGKICKCDHHTHGDYIGDVFDIKEFDADIINKWKTIRPEFKDCADCPMFPVCREAKNCPETMDELCTDKDRAFKLGTLRYSILESYYQYKNQKNNRGE